MVLLKYFLTAVKQLSSRPFFLGGGGGGKGGLFETKKSRRKYRILLHSQ